MKKNKSIFIISSLSILLLLVGVFIEFRIPNGFVANIKGLKWLTGHRNFILTIILGMFTGAFVGAITLMIDSIINFRKEKIEIVELLKEVYLDVVSLANIYNNYKKAGNNIEEKLELRIRTRIRALGNRCNKIIVINGESLVSDNRNNKSDYRSEVNYIMLEIIEMCYSVEKTSKLGEFKQFMEKIKLIILKVNHFQNEEDLKNELTQIKNISSFQI